LTETALPEPEFSASHLQGRITTEKIMDWVRTAGPAFQETIETLVDYHIGITSDPDLPYFLELIRPSELPDIYLSELYSALTPYIKHWANQTDPAYHSVAEMEMVRSDKLLRFLTTAFIKNFEAIFTYFKPGGGPMALLNSGVFVQVPSLTRVGDTICIFKNRDETFILRPESIKEDLESEAYIVKGLHHRGDLYPYYRVGSPGPSYGQRLRHFKYVAYDTRISEPGRLDYLPVRLLTIPTIFIH
jgi:hypothetical protein